MTDRRTEPGKAQLPQVHPLNGCLHYDVCYIVKHRQRRGDTKREHCVSDEGYECKFDPRKNSGYLYQPLSEETWELISQFDGEKTPEQIIVEALKAAANTSASQQRIEQLDKKLCQLGDMIHSIQYAGKVSAEVIYDLDEVLGVYREVREQIALLQAGEP